jgi:amino acid adenylation domain-containing protein/non-ribosomal peptide synthase protein (TIGR01720 family)
MHDAGRQVQGTLHYSAELFERETIRRMAGHLGRLLEAMAADPESRPMSLPLLGGEERRQVLVEWNATGAEYPRQACIHELVARQAERNPDATAVSFRGARLSYRKLERQASRLAGFLRRLGVGPEVRVGVCAERSLELVVGLLGVLKAGGAYVPMDPEYPRERVAYMLSDSRVEVVLTQRRLAAELSGVCGRLVFLEEDEDWDEAGEVGGSGVGAENLAYVIYTSGSTGRPKGVQIQHRSLVSFVVDMGRRLEIGERDRLLSVTSPSFDIFGLELFVPLAHGGQVRLASREATLDGSLLAQELEESRATVMQSTPATWRMLLESGWSGGRELKLLCGGEALPGELAGRLVAKGLVLWNLFGPTETTIWSAVYRVESTREPVPIGRPIGNTQLYVLDGYYEPSPVGVPGELYIGGDGLSRGYLHRGDLTAERFVPNPFGRRGDRIYRTGDLARFLRDGTVEFLGRIDHQVKVRGFRIELGEIEAVLSVHPEVAQPVVVVREDRPGERRLVAYLLGHDGRRPELGGLRDLVVSKLPSYMVPSVFVVLEDLPLTPNGKVDRRRLPPPGTDRPDLTREYVAPRTPVEELLAGIWGEVLGLDRVGVEDNFFQLGGDSILTVQVVARAREAGCQLTLRQIFTHQTVAGLARAADRVERRATKQERTLESFSLIPAGLDPEPLIRRLGGEEEVEDIYPLSPMQQGLLFHSVYAPDSGLYVSQIGCRMTGGLSVDAFKSAWQAAVDRHAILRTAFLWEGLDEPLQVVRRRVELTWEEGDWRELTEAQREERLETFLRRDAEWGFELGQAPLMRLALFRIGKEAYQFVWSHHHLLLDGWCTALVINELFASYESHRQGRELRFAPRRPYRDFIAWLKEQDLGRAEAFWREALRGLSASTPLGFDRSTAGETADDQDYDTAGERLSPALTSDLGSLARRYQVTLNTVLQGAWALLLSRYSRDEDVVFGATVSGRPADLAGVESMLGLFINTLPVRVRVSPGLEVADYLRGIQAQQVEARQYEYSPLAEVQGWSEVPRGTPLFESILVFENYPVDEVAREQGGRTLGIDALRMENRNNLPLTLMVIPGRELSLLLRYDCRRFDSAAIRRLQGHLVMLLGGLVGEPSARLMELPLLSGPERQRLLCEWNSGEASAGSVVCIHELFARQAEESPDATAAVFGESYLSYGELDRRANRLANHLVKLGVGSEVRVGICLERSLDLLVALLGTLKAGGGYVPMEPESPRERLGLMLRDSGARVLLTREGLRESLPVTAGAVVALDGDWDAISREPAELPHSGVERGNLAYVIYTSGSTGTPKGVAVEHRQIVSYVRAVTARLGLAPHGSYALVSTVAADLGNTMLFPSLATGGCLHVIAEEMATDAPALGAYFEERRIDYLKIVPSHLAALHLADGGVRILPRQALVVGGEASSPQWLAQLSAASPAMELFNHYGPTETTVGVLTYRLAPVSALPSSVPLGRPLADTKIYVLDASLGAVPVGVAGELCIGGSGLSRGYLGRGDLTAEKFVPNPYGEAGSRLYRTGDLGRYLADGNVKFLGRIDQQVKVRGFRVELGEIEAVLCRHSGVGQAVVVVREDHPGEKRLVAYVVGQSGRAPEPVELRAHLAALLPEPMVPSWIVALDSVPLTPNGKLNRKALPAPEGWGARLDVVETAPRTEAERALAAIWSEVLRVEAVGVEDNFFELGGDSILGMQVIARARRAGYQLTLKQIFQHPTIARLALVAEPARGGEASQELAMGPVALTPIQRWFFEQELASSHHFNQTVLLKLRERVEIAALEGAVRELVHHHDALRLRFEQEEGSWRQWHARDGAEGIFAVVDLSNEMEWLRTLEADTARVQASLDLTAGPLMRVVHYRLGEAGERLLVAIHHLVVDGVSWRILLEDLQLAYEQLRVGRRVELPPKTTSFQEWARRLTEHARSSLLATEVEHWTSQARGDAARLPVDHPEGENTVRSARSLSVSLSAEETRVLLQDVPGVYRTQINDVLLAALAQALAAWTGRSRVTVELEGHGREELFAGVDLSRTVGWFTSLYPVTLDLSGCTGPGELLTAVKEQIRAIPNRGIGHGVLRYLAEDDLGRQVRGLPAPEMRFNYLGQFDQVLSESGMFAAAAESSGPSRGREGRRSYLLDVNGLVAEGCLQLDWTYSEAVHQRETVEALAGAFIQALRDLVEHCQSPEAGGYTPSDFPLAGLDQDALQRVAALIAGDQP